VYNAAYESIVYAGVAIKHDEEVMLYCEGKITTIIDGIYVQKTRYQLVKPER
jgi:hypothetical protein